MSNLGRFDVLLVRVIGFCWRRLTPPAQSWVAWALGWEYGK